MQGCMCSVCCFACVLSEATPNQPCHRSFIFDDEAFEIRRNGSGGLHAGCTSGACNLQLALGTVATGSLMQEQRLHAWINE